jgi:hypothetical protein
MRHGFYRNQTPIDPHASQEQVERLLKTGEISGCGLPLEYTKQNGQESMRACDWHKSQATTN